VGGACQVTDITSGRPRQKPLLASLPAGVAKSNDLPLLVALVVLYIKHAIS